MENIEEKEEGKILVLIKKLMIVIISLFLIALILTYIIPGPKLLSIIEGKIISNELNNNLSITLKDETIITFDEKTYDELWSIYNNNQIHEFKVCLHGTLNNNVYYLNKIEHPIIYSQDIFSVTSSPCSKETLVSLHSHPENQCIHSSQDIKSHKSFQEINPEAISAVMCSGTRFNFYK
jgi:proteasome lid subunit RPN8/RPN11